ncbi:MAG: T9SS type A sorting domain-containing protein [Bacteroidales bacterium]
MKKGIILLFLLGLITSSLYSQVVVNQSDMPVAGDTLRVSVTNIVPDGYASTAMDTTWNFSALEALSQRVDTFASTSVTPSIYQLIFVLQGGANLASPRSSIPIPGIPVSQGYTFFKNSSVSYSDLGSAYTVQGLPLPAKYDVPDKLYQFPLAPGAAWASTSVFGITIPGMASYNTMRIRSSVVDGWGLLTTPYGSFQTIRVRSDLTVHDSVYIDSLGTGFPIIRDIIEYKWLAKGKGIPVLQINEEQGLTTATYRDIPRMSALPLSVSLGPDTAVFRGTTLTINATVSGGTPPYQFLWIPMNMGNSITVTVQDSMTYGVMVFDALQNFATDSKVVYIRYPDGMIEPASGQLECSPNPSNGIARVTIPGLTSEATVRVFNARGKSVTTLVARPVEGQIQINLNDQLPGLYFLHITGKNKNFTSKLQIIR